MMFAVLALCLYFCFFYGMSVVNFTVVTTLFVLQYFVFCASGFAELFSLVVNTEPIPCPDGSEIVCGKCGLLCLHETVSLCGVFFLHLFLLVCQHFPVR